MRRFPPVALLLAGIVAHLVLMYAVIDVYFQTPVIKGVPAAPPTEEGPTRRLVLMVADGLRADYLFQDNPGVEAAICRDVRADAPECPTLRAPFLHDAAKKGRAGYSHTRPPTESRPGHVAITAGFYEDPSALFSGWQVNLVQFDSIFNRTVASWGFGSPDVVPMFQGQGTYKFDAYAAEMEDFSREDLSELDTWAFQRAHALVDEARFDAEHPLRAGPAIVFLHLLGLDSNSHAHGGPATVQYLENIEHVDAHVASLTRHFGEAFPDGRTTYLLTADHGMTDWASHGAGSPAETETPYVMWGAGVEPQRGEAACRPRSGAGAWLWGRHCGEAHEAAAAIHQAQLAPLMAALLGVAVPVNNAAGLPSALLPLHGRAHGGWAAARQLVAAYRARAEQVALHSLHFTHYAPMEREAIELQQRIGELMEAATPSSLHAAALACDALSGIALEGLLYLQRYDWAMLISATVLGFLAWMAALAVHLPAAMAPAAAAPRASTHAYSDARGAGPGAPSAPSAADLPTRPDASRAIDGSDRAIVILSGSDRAIIILSGMALAAAWGFLAWTRRPPTYYPLLALPCVAGAAAAGRGREILALLGQLRGLPTASMQAAVLMRGIGIPLLLLTAGAEGFIHRWLYALLAATLAATHVLAWERNALEAPCSPGAHQKAVDEEPVGSEREASETLAEDLQGALEKPVLAAEERPGSSQAAEELRGSSQACDERPGSSQAADERAGSSQAADERAGSSRAADERLGSSQARTERLGSHRAAAKPPASFREQALSSGAAEEQSESRRAAASLPGSYEAAGNRPGSYQASGERQVLSGSWNAFGRQLPATTAAAATLAAGAATLLPIHKPSSAATVAGGGMLIAVMGLLSSGALHRRAMRGEREGVLWAQAGLVILTCALVLFSPPHTAVGLRPSLCRLASRALFVISPLGMFLASPVPRARASAILLALAPAFLLVSLSWEPFFFAALAVSLRGALELDARWKGRGGLGHDLLRGTVLLLGMNLAFLGVGNIPAVSSFQVASVYRLVTAFDPFVMGGLLAIKIALPLFLVAAAAALADPDPARLAGWAVLGGDVAALRFFFAVRAEGSWADIGASLGHYGVGLVQVILLPLLLALAHVFTTACFFRHAKPMTVRARKDQ